MLILASQSPRRRALLSMLGLPFQIHTADIDETMDPLLPPEEEVMRVSEAKARAVAALHPDDTVCGFDTVVDCNGEVFGKPRNEADALRMLRDLSDGVQISRVLLRPKLIVRESTAAVSTAGEME